MMQETGTLAGHKWWVLRVESLDGLGIYFGFFHWFQTMVGAFLIILSIVSLFLVGIHSVLVRVGRRKGQDLVFATVAVISIWIANLVVLWPENLVTASAMSAYSRQWGTGNNDDFCTDSQVGSWRKKACAELPKVLTIFDWDTGKFKKIAPFANDVLDTQKAALRGDFGLNINGYYPVMWFEGVFLGFIIVLGLCGGLVWIARQAWTIWARRCDLARFQAPEGAAGGLASWPRLIVADIYTIAVIGLMAIVWMICLLHSGLLGDLEERLASGFLDGITELPHELPIPFPWVKLGVITFVVLSALAATYIRDITKLILDVVNHFATPQKDFPVRRRIEQRFHQTIDFLVQNGDNPHLVVIAHSQGTVITYDALRDGLWNEIKGRVQSLTVVTFGSPLTHVYQHYFARLYPSLSAVPALRSLRHEPRFKWINVYRVDDFVGTYIENSIPGFPANIALSPGGHTAYWQRDAFEVLFAHERMQTVLPTATAAPSYIAPV